MKKESILPLIYPLKEIFVKDFSFHQSELLIKSTCVVPVEGYAKQTIPYVTAENYFRCISQASYLHAHHMIKNNLIDTKVTEQIFLNKMELWELYYRDLSIKFHARQKRGEPFAIELLLDPARLNKIRKFITLAFSIQRTVISGEVSYLLEK